jgi:hypothetical protein
VPTPTGTLSQNVNDVDVNRGVDDGSSDAGQSPTIDGPMPACLGGPGIGPIDVYGVDCYAGGPLSGACNEDTPACTFCALPVLCSPTYGPRTFYSCACSGGAWSCATTAQDGAVCSLGG